MTMFTARCRIMLPLLAARGLACVFALMAALAGGCNIVTPIAYAIEGPPTVDAVYELPNVPTVVFVDDRRSVVNPQSLREVIGNSISSQLMSEKLVTHTISTRDALAYARAKERNGALLSMEEIGQAVGAEQVIYVEMLAFTDTPDGATPRPTAVCAIRVIDVAKRTRLFPPADSPASSHTVQISGREVDPAMYRSRTDRLKIFEMLAADTADRIAKLFYEHERKALGSSLTPPQ